jgi:hypothetical protein
MFGVNWRYFPVKLGRAELPTLQGKPFITPDNICQVAFLSLAAIKAKCIG